MSVDAEDVFKQAIRFDYSADLLVNHAIHQWQASRHPAIDRWIDDNGNARMSVPGALLPPATLIVSFVCEAFCVELFLKTIMAIENIALPQKHELSDLFQRLPQSWKDEIEKHYATIMADKTFSAFRHPDDSPPGGIEFPLAKAAKAFVQWRYFYEGSPPGHYLAVPIVAIRTAILAAKPDWKQYYKDLNRPLQSLAPSTTIPDACLQWTLMVGSPRPTRRPRPANDSPGNQSE